MKKALGAMATLAATAGLCLSGALALKPSSMAASGDPRLGHETASLPDQAQVWAWQEALNRFGVRLTGTKAHRDSIDYLERELRRMGLEVHRDRHPFTKWEPRAWSLTALDGLEGGQTLSVAGYFPYSGTTGPEGRVAELAPCGTAPGDFRGAAGKIALVEVPVSNLPSFLLFRKRSAFPASEGIPFWVSSPVLSSVLKRPDLARAKAAGALGVIAVWKGVSSATVQGQTLPFTTALQDCPTLWVDAPTGDRLGRLAASRAKVRMVLDAEVDRDASTDTIYAILPGTSGTESILINTHTDGPNAAEENGAVGLLAMASHFARQPAESRRRDMVFAFVTGHFQLPQFGHGHEQATTRWLRDHPELWDGKGGHKRAVAGLTLEHLGCKEWRDKDDRTGAHETGRLETELVYTGNPVMDRLYLDALAGRKKVRSITLRPVNGLHFGEGQPLFEAGIPNIALVPAPDYLCAAGENGYLDRLDPAFMHEQVRSFISMASALDATPTERLGKPEPYAGFLHHLIKPSY